MFNSWGIVNAYGTYASYYMQHLLPGQDILLFNLIGSTQSFIVLLFSAVVGRFLDAGYHRTLIIIGSVLVVLGQFLLSVSVGDGGYGQGNYGLIWLTQGPRHRSRHGLLLRDQLPRYVLRTSLAAKSTLLTNLQSSLPGSGKRRVSPSVWWLRVPVLLV
jgi:hypothetical protein